MGLIRKRAHTPDDEAQLGSVKRRLSAVERRVAALELQQQVIRRGK